MLKKIFFLVLIIIIATLLISLNKLNAPADAGGADQAFVIKEGEGTNQISENLFEQKLIKSKLAFETYVWARDWEGKFKAGEHQLSPKLNVREIALALTKGTSISRETDIRIIEGWNTNDIKEYLVKNNISSAEDFDQAIKKPIGEWQEALGNPRFISELPSGEALEGYLFPDTYRIFKGAKTEDIFNKMLANFEKKVDPQLRAEAARQGKSLKDIIIVASLIEKEVRTEKDMKIVSGILWDRLKIGQALQLDATLSYILGNNKDRHSGDELNTESPYNTYRNKGLPPGPICNPGLNAVKAAVYPTQTDYNYFLTAKVNGEDKVIFSKSFEEHVKNKGIYLR